MNIQFKKGALEVCVLAVVSKRDYYGYELVQVISANIDIAEGTVYPLLRRLSKEGYFEPYIQESDEGPARKYYRITKKGTDYTKALTLEWRGFVQGVENLIGKEEAE